MTIPSGKSSGKAYSSASEFSKSQKSGTNPSLSCNLELEESPKESVKPAQTISNTIHYTYMYYRSTTVPCNVLTSLESELDRSDRIHFTIGTDSIVPNFRLLGEKVFIISADKILLYLRIIVQIKINDLLKIIRYSTVSGIIFISNTNQAFFSLILGFAVQIIRIRY